jgi:ABC-type uncharacterized transport system substrate-binding protein
MKNFVGVILATVLLVAMAGCSQHKVLLVTDYAKDSPRLEQVLGEVVARFKSEGIAHKIEVVSADARSQLTDAWRDGMADTAYRHAETMKPNVILIAGDNMAKHFGMRLRNKSWPVVYFDIKQDPSRYRFDVSTNCAGIQEKVDVGRIYSLIKNLVPGARRVGVLADRSLEGTGVIEQIKAEKDAFLSVTTIVRAADRAEWMNGLRRIQKNADVLLIASYSSLPENEHDIRAIPEVELLKMTAAANRLPDFTFWPEHVGPDTIMAAETVPVGAQADFAAEIAARVMVYGSDISKIQPTTVRDRARVISVERATKLNIIVPEVVLKAEPTQSRRNRNWMERFKGLFMLPKRPVVID